MRGEEDPIVVDYGKRRVVRKGGHAPYPHRRTRFRKFSTCRGMDPAWSGIAVSSATGIRRAPDGASLAPSVERTLRVDLPPCTPPSTQTVPRCPSMTFKSRDLSAMAENDFHGV